MNPSPAHIAGGIALAALLTLIAPTPQAAPRDSIPLSTEQQSALGIGLAAPQAADRAMSRRYPAQVAVPVRQAHVVSAPQDGTLTLLLVALGDPVTAGQPLAQMQSPGLLEAQGALLRPRPASPWPRPSWRVTRPCLPRA